MASNGSPSQALQRVVAAYEQTTKANIPQSQKVEALQYLEAFQKSPEAWTLLFEMLQTQSIPAPVQMFAATSLKGKMIHDVHQLPRNTLPQLRQSLFDMMLKYQDGPKPIRTQLAICLAHLAIQMTEWKDVLPTVINTFSGKGPGATACFLEFLNILAEEVTEGRKIALTEDELVQRTQELLQDNVDSVFQMLSSYAQSDSAANDPVFISCVQSWTKEISLSQIASSPILMTIFKALDSSDAFDAAIECIITMVRETSDVDDSIDDIKTLTPLILNLRPKLAEAAEEEDSEVFKGLGRLFSECGEKWVVLVSREPRAFRPLVETILQVCILDWEKEAIGYTFQFWEDLKLWLVLEKYEDARQIYSPFLSRLVDIMIEHLRFPEGEGLNDKDLFNGNREQEERFRNYRHEMGNVLKDCCEVLGVSDCLSKTYALIEAWVGKYGLQANSTSIPHWQELEAPIFALRALGQTVPPDEDTMLPRLIPLLVQIPDHEKIRYQAVMTLGRYTEWTAQHPDTLEMQLQFIMAAFDHPSKEVVRGATHAFQYFCNDCAELLKGFFGQIHSFFVTVINRLPDQAQNDVSEGMAAILAKQPIDELYQKFKLCCDPILENIVQMGQNATDDKVKFMIADKIQLITIFIQKVQPYVEPPTPNPAVRYCQDINPILSELASNFQSFIPILERVCRCWRYMVLSYRASAAPILQDLASKLVTGFQATQQGCFLWATDSIVREFSEHQLAEDENGSAVDPSIVASMVSFWERQTVIFLSALNDVGGDQLPDLIEDFFRLCMDMLMNHTTGTIRSQHLRDVMSAAVHALSLLKVEVLMVTLHFLRDLISYGLPDSPISTLSGPDRSSDKSGTKTPTDVQARIKGLLSEQGRILSMRVLTGMMYSFPEDCIADASGVVLDLLKVLPVETTSWIGETLLQLPAGHIRPHERERLVAQIDQKMRSNDMIKIRFLLQDFTSSYRRRNVAPREGLGMLEPSKFVYSGA